MGIIKSALQRLNPLPELSFNGISFPSQHEARWLTDQVKHSPDLGYLEQFEFQLYFTPDDTRVGHERHSMIADGAPLCTAYTQDTFSYWVQETQRGDVLERIPIPMRQQGQPSVRYFPPALKIKGEIHAIRPWQFRGLDDHKRNREQFRRQRVNLLVPYREVVWRKDHTSDGQPLPPALQGKNGVHGPERVHVIRAWMYVGIPEYWDELFDAGFRGFKTVNHYESRRSWLKEYYDFPRKPRPQE